MQVRNHESRYRLDSRSIEQQKHLRSFIEDTTTEH